MLMTVGLYQLVLILLASWAWIAKMRREKLYFT